MYKAFASFLLMVIGMTACASAQSSYDERSGYGSELHFDGEYLIAEYFYDDEQIIALVRSCAPLKAGCERPKLKARSLTFKFGKPHEWTFADLDYCPVALKLAKKIETTELLVEHMDEFRPAVSPCLTTSYMTPPWERGALRE